MANQAQWKTETLVLKYLVTIDDKTYSSITVREPDVEALEKIEELGVVEGAKTTIRQTRGMIAALADVPEAVILKLHRFDLMAVGELLAPLVGEDEEEA